MILEPLCCCFDTRTSLILIKINAAKGSNLAQGVGEGLPEEGTLELRPKDEQELSRHRGESCSK